MLPLNFQLRGGAMGNVRVERNKDRIWLVASFEDAGPKLAKEIPGASWRKSNRVWTYPLNLHTCRDLRRVFGDKLVIGPELTAWARAAVAHEKEMTELGRKMDADLQVVPEISPRLAKAMSSRTYQRSGSRFVARGMRVLIADEPGLGKTATALGGLMEAGFWEGSHLVIAPKTSLVSTWARQIRLWTDAEAWPMPEGRAAREQTWREFKASTAPSKFLIVNPAMIRVLAGVWCAECDKWIVVNKQKNKPEHYYFRHKEKTIIKKADWLEIIQHEWDSAILDECHEELANWKPSNVNQEREGLSRIQPQVRIALTGTPLRGHEIKLWGTLKWLDRVRGGYWAWIETWFNLVKKPYYEILGPRTEKMDEFHKQIDTVTRRITKKEARPDLPDKEWIPVWLTLEGKHRRQYGEFLEEGEISLAGGKIIAATGPLAELTRLKQLSFGVWENVNGDFRPTTDSPKIEWLLQALAERGVTGDPKTEFLPEEGLGYKYVIASQWEMILEAVNQALGLAGIKTLKVSGSVTGKKRDATVARFQSDDKEYRVLLINTKAGGVSIDLDAWCDEMFVLDETWISDDQVQLEGRIDNRTGRVSPRTFYYLRTEGTVEEEIAEGNLSQDEMQKALLDSRRGVEVASRIIRKLKESLKK
jgi:SNF2 family DNA or RNA helicase